MRAQADGGLPYINDILIDFLLATMKKVVYSFSRLAFSKLK